jgi:carbamoylphosphate synthase large subunit
MPAFRTGWSLFPALKGAIVIPMKEAHAMDMPRGVHALSPSPESVHTLMDKGRFARYMEANGLGDYCPRVYSAWTEAQFPSVLKRTDCASSYGISMVASLAEVDALLKGPLYSRGNCILQEAIPGTTEYCTYCVLEAGRILWSRTFVNDIATPLTIRTGSNALKRRPIETPRSTLAQIGRVLMPLAYSGPCNIDYKLQGDRMRIFEINARLGGTLMEDEFCTELRDALACIISRAAFR